MNYNESIISSLFKIPTTGYLLYCNGMCDKPTMLHAVKVSVMSGL